MAISKDDMERTYVEFVAASSKMISRNTERIKLLELSIESATIACICNADGHLSLDSQEKLYKLMRTIVETEKELFP